MTFRNQVFIFSDQIIIKRDLFKLTAFFKYVIVYNKNK